MNSITNLKRWANVLVCSKFFRHTKKYTAIIIWIWRNMILLIKNASTILFVPFILLFWLFSWFEGWNNMFLERRMMQTSMDLFDIHEVCCGSSWSIWLSVIIWTPLDLFVNITWVYGIFEIDFYFWDVSSKEYAFLYIGVR